VPEDGAIELQRRSDLPEAVDESGAVRATHGAAGLLPLRVPAGAGLDLLVTVPVARLLLEHSTRGTQ